MELIDRQTLVVAAREDHLPQSEYYTLGLYFILLGVYDEKEKVYEAQY